MEVYGLLILAFVTLSCCGGLTLPKNYPEFTKSKQQHAASQSFSNKGCPQTSYQFPNVDQTTNYLRLKRPIPNLKEFTYCGWYTRYNKGEDYWISYANSQRNNAFIFGLKGNEIHIHINNKMNKISVIINTNTEYHICVSTFASSTGRSYVFINGQLMHIIHGVPSVISGGGVFIIGQEQDSVAGGFVASQSIQGKVSNFMLWNRILGFGEIANMYNNRCRCPGEFMISLEKEEVQQYGAVSAIMPPECSG